MAIHTDISKTIVAIPQWAWHWQGASSSEKTEAVAGLFGFRSPINPGLD